MSYFLPSFLQKRILRYALSRLELLDTEALDLENLGIAWGKRSTVELRDIGVHTKKLSALLHLPPGILVAKAKLSLLRLTIPADLYKSGILVEADGVELCLKVDLTENDRHEAGESNDRKSSSSKNSNCFKTQCPRHTKTRAQDPSSRLAEKSGNNEHSSELLPTTVDLAESFFQTEPEEETAELQAAIAQSQFLGQSQTSSENGSEAPGPGIGNSLSLPGFLAGFLKGVGDRIQVNVKDVGINIDVRLELPSESSAKIDTSDRSEVVTIRVAVGDAAMDGITNCSAVDKLKDGLKIPGTCQHEKRRISFNKVEAMLISEPYFFTNLTRPAVPPSPKATHADTVTTPRCKFPATLSTTDTQGVTQYEIPRDMVSNLQTARAAASSATADYKDSYTTLGFGEDSGRVMALGEFSSIGESQYQDGALPGSSFSNGVNSQVRKQGMERSVVLADNSTYEDPASDDTSPRDSLRPDNYPNPESPRTHKSLAISLDASPIASLTKEISDSSPRYLSEPTNHRNDPDLRREHSANSSPSKYSSLESDSSPPLSEDLTQSNIFSHEQAASMYMSAISHASIRQTKSSTRMPGDWQSSVSDEEDHQKSEISRRDLSQTENATSPLQQPLASADGLISGEHREEQLIDREATPKPLSAGPISPAKSKKTRSPSSPRLASHLTVDNDNKSSSDSESSLATSKSSLTMVKRVLIVDSVVLELPQGASKLTSDSCREQRLSFAAGCSEVARESERGSNVRDFSSSHSLPRLKRDQSSDILSGNVSCEVFSIIVGDVQILGDLGLIKMIILIAEQSKTGLRRASFPVKEQCSVQKESYVPDSALLLQVKHISWKFLDLVKGLPFVDIQSSHTSTGSHLLTGGSEVLLRADIQEFHVNYRNLDRRSISNVSAGKFVFGYATNDIISFDSGLKMRESNRDILAPVDNDIFMKIERSSTALEIDLVTLPLHFSLDLRRLDEAFGWFGGFSSMLGLGNSMVSTVTVIDARPKPSYAAKATRGVHFETLRLVKAPRPEIRDTQNKISARIGGLRFDLQGTKSALCFESTAMKLINRSEGLGLQVDRLNMSGPYLQALEAEPSLVVKLSNLRIEYLSTPKELDLARLLALLSPSKDKYERDDDILLETLLRQRRQGGVIRVTIESAESCLSKTADLQYFPALAEELKKLSTVAKYLPEDDRPGVLTLGLVRTFTLNVNLDDKFGLASLTSKNVKIAHVTFPSLLALGIDSLALRRNHIEELIGEGPAVETNEKAALPMIMARFVGNEMEPTAKVKLYNIRVEYHVSTVMAMLGLSENESAVGIASDMASSIVNLTGRRTTSSSQPRLSTQDSVSSDTSFANSIALRLDVVLRNSIIGLNPRNSTAKGLVVLTDTHFTGSMPKGEEANATLEIRKASLMVIDDLENIIDPKASASPAVSADHRSQTDCLVDMGFVSVSLISAAKATLQVVKLETDKDRSIDVEFRDDLFVLESCADSTQTLQAIMNGLRPPMPSSQELKYRTEIVPVEDMLASFSGADFATTHSNRSRDYDPPLGFDEGDMMDDEVPQNLEFVSSFYNPNPEAVYEGIADSMLEDDLESLASPSVVREIGDKDLLESFQEQTQIAPGNAPLDFQEDHFRTKSTIGGTAHRWNSKQNTYGLPSEFKLDRSQLKIRVRDVHMIWNLYDGYDWQRTRDTISQAVADVQSKATERLSRKDKRGPFDPDEEDEDVIGDFLFNSIYIGIPANRDPTELARQVNSNIDDLASETGSYATSISSRSPSRQACVPRSKSSKLQFKRSRYHKMTFELKGVAADVVFFPPGSGETQSSIDVRVQDLEIFDHVPTSTWKKFATYMHDAGERESGTSMVHIEILNVKPVPDLAASEIILKATILPLRLHVDQDALDFMNRFFEFKDDNAPSQSSIHDSPFLQRVEVNSVRVRLDFKPKRVNYAGIRSGHTNEFMNFFVLDRADMVLRHVIIYGVSGFDRLGKTLNDIWMPDIKHNQLPGILAGLAPVRSLVNVGSGVRDLVVVPIREYKKDGRVVRSFQKGALAFAKTTTSELVKLGAKLAIGTQTVLQGAEDLLSQSPQKGADALGGWENAELDEEEKKQISLYAAQPVGVVQGLKGAYASLERDLLTAKDAVVAMPGEIMESSTAGGAAKAVLRGAPTIILRPALGVSKAVGQTLMGATNSLDPKNKSRAEDKYKRH